jgi:hypothetical protein
MIDQDTAMRTQVLKSSNTCWIIRSSYPPNNGALSPWENVPLSMQIDPPLKDSGKPPRMMQRHLQMKPNTWNSRNPFSSARMNPSSMNGAPPLLETPNWCTLSLSAQATDVESSCN